VPRSAPPGESSLYKEARAFLAPPRLFGPAGRDATLPSRRSFLEATGAVVLSALKRADDRETLILRVFNPGDAAETLALPGTPAAFATDLGERRVTPLPTADDHLEVAVAPRQMRTIEVP
jgi:alpha-mannosidase